MEVGPLARVLVSFMSGVPEVVAGVTAVCQGLNLPVEASTIVALNSALGRLAARPIEASAVAGYMLEWCVELVALLKLVEAGDFKGNPWFTNRVRDNGEGEGFWEAPRGALYHTEKIAGNKITHYQEIVPTTWNISPRDAKDVMGTIEQGLIGTPISNIEAPINALRIVHGYDPCVACAVHITEPKTGREFKTHMSPWGGR